MAADVAKKKKQRAYKRGQSAEYIAAFYLLCKGYRILSLRFKTPIGEIDIVAKRGNLIAFIEVKARSTKRDAVDAVSFQSQYRIRSASEIWLARYDQSRKYSYRYDIIALQPLRLPQHLIDAF